MPQFTIQPHAGINKRFPEHKLAGKKSQFVIQLKNLLSLDGRIYKIPGGEKYDSTAKQGTATWGKRIYYTEGQTDKRRHQFTVIGGKMYRGTDATRTLNQVPVIENGQETYDARINDGQPMDATLKVAGTVTTFLVDGEDFYKFDGNMAGSWERIPAKLDVDGNTIEPIDIVSYLDRAFILVKNRNVILFSKLRDPENYSDSTDAGLIQVPPGNGGFPVKLIVHRGFLFLVHEDYITPVSGSSPATFGVKPGDIMYGFGSRAPRSVITVKERFGFLNSEDNEFYTTNGTIDSTDKVPISYPIKLSSLINPGKAYLTQAIHDPNTDGIRIAYWESGGVLAGSAEAVYSTIEEKWCGETSGRNISFYCLWNGDGDNGELITGRSDVGAIMLNNVGLNWDGSAINYKLVTGSYLMSEDRDIQIRSFYLDAKPTGNHVIAVSYYIDSRITTYGEETPNMQGEILTLGYIEIADQTVFLQRCLPKIDRSKGRMIRFQVEGNTLNSLFELYGIIVETATGGALKQSKYLSGV